MQDYDILELFDQSECANLAQDVKVKGNGNGQAVIINEHLLFQGMPNKYMLTL